MTDQSVSVIVRHIIGNNDTLQTQSNHGDQDLRLKGKVSTIENKIFGYNILYVTLELLVILTLFFIQKCLFFATKWKYFHTLEKNSKLKPFLKHDKKVPFDLTSGLSWAKNKN